MKKERQPIRILHVVDSLNAGGMENVLVRVANRLSQRNFDISVCCLAERGVLASRLPKVLALDKPPGISFKTFTRLAKGIKRNSPHIVHSHNIGALLYTAGARFLSPHTILLHGEHTALHTQPQRHIYMRRLLYPFCNAVHTVSENQKKQLVALRFSAEKIHSIVNGVDTINFAPGEKTAAKSRLGVVNDLVMGIVARLIPCKRHSLLLRAVSLLPESIPVKLLIVGDGEEEGSLRQLAQTLKITDKIYFCGYQDDPTGFYDAMDLFVLPSIREGLCNSILEAMACGVPVLANDIDGNAEVIEHEQNGWLCSMNSAEDIAAQLMKLLKAPSDLAAMGIKARQSVLADFNFERTVDQYEKLYRQLLEVNNRS